MLSILHRYQARKTEDDTEAGFTLIELLIVIVVLGILAAVTVFALSSIGGTSAVAACNTDAASVNTASAAYSAGNSGSYPASVAALTTSTNGGPYLQSVPSTAHYNISLNTTGQVVVGGKGATAGTAIWTPGSSVCSVAS